jgi:hypothetical protein
MGFNNLKPQESLSPPKVIKTIERDPKLSDLLNERFQTWKKFYIKEE